MQRPYIRYGPTSKTKGWYVLRDREGKFVLSVTKNRRTVRAPVPWVMGIILSHALAGQALDPQTNHALVKNIMAQTGHPFSIKSFKSILTRARDLVEKISEGSYTISNGRSGFLGRHSNTRLVAVAKEELTTSLPTCEGWLVCGDSKGNSFLVRGDASQVVTGSAAIIITHALAGKVLDPELNSALVTEITAYTRRPFNRGSFNRNLMSARSAVEKVSKGTYTILRGRNGRGGTRANVKLVPLPIIPA